MTDMSKSTHEKLDEIISRLSTIEERQANHSEGLKEHKRDLGAHAGSALAWGTLFGGLAAFVRDHFRHP